MQVRYLRIAGIAILVATSILLLSNGSEGEALFPSMAGEVVTLRLMQGGKVRVNVSYEVAGDMQSGQTMVFLKPSGSCWRTSKRDGTVLNWRSCAFRPRRRVLFL
jgi:hypothetical protein